MLFKYMRFSRTHREAGDFSFADKIKIIFKDIKSMLRRPNYHASKFAFISHAVLRRKKVAGRYFDIISDYYANIIGDDLLILEWPTFLRKHFKPVYSKNIFFLDHIISKIDLYRFIYMVKMPLIFKDFSLFIYDKIQENFSTTVKIEINELLRLMRNFAAVLKITSELSNLLTAISPKILFMKSGCDGGIAGIINKISTDLNIITIDVQHGVINEMQPSYNYPKELFGYYRNYLPKYVFVWGDYWKEKIENSIPSTPIVVGNPHLIHELRNRKNIQREAKTILFISQGTIGYKLAEIAFDLSEKLRDWKIIYKLHPGETYNAYSKYKKLYQQPNIQVVDDPTVNIYDLFAKVSYVVGMYSTALYEAIAFGFKPFIFEDEISKLVMKDLVDKDYAVFFNSSLEFIEHINQCNKILLNDSEISYIWNMDFESKIRCTISSLF